MKKVLLYTALIFFSFLMLCMNPFKVDAKELLASKNLNTISGDTIGTINVYDNGEIDISYKYGLRKATLYYCEKGDDCDYGTYMSEIIMESNINEPYKNTTNQIATFSYKAKNLDAKKEYGLRVEVYFGVSSSYKGTESIFGSPIISSVQVLETENHFVKPEEDVDYGGDGVKELMNKIKNIVNSVGLPILYAVIGLILVVKGVVLGVQIVKSADEPQVRQEKVGSLKWLVIGVGIAFAASTFVGVITGFFSEVFS